MKIENLSLWQAFYAVGVQGNFTKASKSLNLTLPQLSKRIAKLEDQLNVRLFQRSTRSVSLTEEGQLLLPRVSLLLEDSSNLENLFEKKNIIQGRIRIASVGFIAEKLLLSAMDSFLKKNPDVQFDLEISEIIINLVDANIDLAFRVHQNPPDSSLVYRKLLPNSLVVCASPKYLKTHATIKHPKDLSEHQVLSLAIHNKCRFEKSELRVVDIKKIQKIVAQDGRLMTQMALQGFGVLIRSKWDVQEYLKAGELVQVLKNHPLDDFGNIYAVTPSKRLLTARVKTFLDHVAAEFKKNTL